MPPATSLWRRPITWTSGCSASLTCWASSRVGTRITERTTPGLALPPAARVAMSGRPKPSVLPEPVWPRPRTSRPARASGMVACWIGNGVVMPSRARRSTSGAGRPRAAKPLSVSTVTGAASAGTSTDRPMASRSSRSVQVRLRSSRSKRRGPRSSRLKPPRWGRSSRLNSRRGPRSPRSSRLKLPRWGR